MVWVQSLDRDQDWPKQNKNKKTREINVSDDVEKREPLNTVAENVNWYGYYEKQYEYSPTK